MVSLFTRISIVIVHTNRINGVEGNSLRCRSIPVGANQMTTQFHCDRCGQDKTHNEPHTTGYGVNDAGQKVCFACCAEVDREQMIATGRACLYLTYTSPVVLRGNYKPIGNATVSNWPGTLKISATFRKGRHNIAGTRYDVWFTGPDGKSWHGVQYGENTQICHCRRMKG